MIDPSLMPALKSVAADAAAKILEVYDSPFAVEHKEDRTPLTEADLAAHRCIVAGLQKLTPGVPILSEESADIDYAQRRSWTSYWLVDPLDGTREFIKRNGEFTVNIAFIEAQRPVLGVVWVPVSGRCYSGALGHGAFVQDGAADPAPIRVRTLDPRRVVIAGSRSHGNAETQAFIERVQAHHPDTEMRAIGSSLKFCLVAEGKVDVYPRFGPTSEWDTGAAQAVVEAAGGFVTDVDMAPLRYNTKESYLNPHFLVFGDPDAGWRAYMD